MSTNTSTGFSIPSSSKASSPNIKIPGGKSVKAPKQIATKAPNVGSGGMKAYLAASKGSLFSGKTGASVYNKK